jgi:proline iminopeptidase
MRQLFNAIEPYASHTLPVSDVHRLHVEECGRPDVYRIILFDQRGCGRSVPHAELTGNNTGALVADMEAIRNLLGIERWVVFGGSWGSTLGLVYAETHPERVLGLILRGIFLCRPRDIHWFYQEGASYLLPERWEEYVAPVPEEERTDLVGAYYRRLTGSDEISRMAAAKAWSLWEAHASNLLPKPAVVNHFGNPHTALSLARIECHYFMHDSFLEPDQILKHAGRLAGIPGVIVHGRYDVVCPAEQAWALHRAWPEAHLHMIADAGHSALEPGIVDALVTATIEMAMRVR